jgi:hypothetical protein
MIIRRRLTKRFTTVDNALFDDESLSVEAIGVLCYLLGRPNDWRVNLEQISKKFGIGRQRTQNVFRQIMASGYAHREQHRDPDTGAWGPVEYVITDEPAEVVEAADSIDETDPPRVENQPAAAMQQYPSGTVTRSPQVDLPRAGNQPAAYREDSTKTERYKSERETRAREPLQEVDPFTDRTFMAFMATWPTAAADDLVRSHNAWLALTEAERNEAAASVPRFLVYLRTVERDGVCGAFSYLKQRRWKLLPAVSGKLGADPAPIELKNFSLAFWASMHLRIRRGERVGVTMKAAVEGKRWPTPLRDIADAEAELALVRMDTKSAEAAAWLDYFRRLQIFSLRPEEIVAPFVWMPARWPPGHASEVAVMDDDDVML